jgi:uncharacterized protein (TIGR02246 family)
MTTTGTVEDELAIRRLLASYCQLVDDGRFDDWIALFTDDAEFVVMGMHKRGHDEIRGFIEPTQQPDVRGVHTISAPIISLDGDTATSTVDFVWLSRAGDIGQVGRYHDVVVRRPQGWCFRRREIVFAGNQPIPRQETR